MARAFLYAGSRAVLVNLWSVADQETATLMTDVYSQLQQGKPAPDVLRAALLAIIRAGKAALPGPLHPHWRIVKRASWTLM